MHDVQSLTNLAGKNKRKYNSTDYGYDADSELRVEKRLAINKTSN